ncbi:type II secretion system F family protein [Patescibacteria group bacterium]|nr:type II secretion system F family protein [Patescibacteria group bacterium]MCG2702235.1 type II secretion system F family protein [Candidatus Parcubacteria bacterium]MBU4210017.1 type II secretion system F family protein [Patescibacteria group bacterium]MBU4264751.1 type II secretion system F family protein [Patescibacteria group bacterium]MBU4390089.1 type II secretion system F family protein [Patescibacteria group bacterium]
MPLFKYKATDKKGKLIADIINASSEKEAESLLKDKGYQVLVLKEQKEGSLSADIKISGKFPVKEKISICRYLSTMMNAGLPLEESVNLLIKGTENKTVKKVLQDISFSIRKGSSLHSSFGKYPKFFDDIFLAMVKTGEISGTLDQSFNHLSIQFKREEDLRKKVIGSLLYPAIIISLMLAIGLLMLTFVLPRLGKVFTNLNVELPPLTKLLLNISLFMQKNSLAVLLSVPVLIFLLTLFFRSKKGGRLIYLITSKLPVLKDILLHYNLTRFNQSLSALLKGGVSIGESLEIACQSLILPGKKKLADQFAKEISQGTSLTEVFLRAKIFPSLMTQMVAVGEKTGTLEKTLLDTATFYQEEVENSLKNFITLLEPILMIIVGIAVGFMVLTFISPIYSLIGKLQPN